MPVLQTEKPASNAVNPLTPAGKTGSIAVIFAKLPTTSPRTGT
jgi:hypothetical protein